MRVLVATFVLASAMLAAGTVARQTLNWHDRPILGWSCPSCGTRNASDPEAAFHATCRRCAEGYEWQRVLPRHETPEVVAALNGRRPPGW